LGERVNFSWVREALAKVRAFFIFAIMKKLRNLYRRWFLPPGFTIFKAHGTGDFHSWLFSFGPDSRKNIPHFSTIFILPVSNSARDKT
jgi:hypothetical protein